jgi:ribonuclease HI
MDKTEYIHFHRGRAPIEIGITINTGSETVEVLPQEQIKWLGMWLDRKLTFKKHVEVRCAAATRAFHSIRRLSNTSKGLSFQATRQLYIACVEAVGAYGVPCWWDHNHSQISGFERLQNSALRIMLGQFRTAPIGPMEIEAAIPPIHIQFDRITRFYGVRVLKLQPDHPVRKLITPPKKANQQAWIKTRSLKRNKLRTQLENIMAAIGSKRGYYQLESFKLQRDMPWKRTIEQLPGVTIQISKESKDETAKQHTEWLEANERAIENLIFYTDASKQNSNGKTGAAVYRVSGHNTKDWMWHLGECMEVFDAELFAIERAFVQSEAFLTTYREKGVNCPIRKVFIFSDSQSGMKRINNLITRPGQTLIHRITECATRITKKFPGVTIQIEWVPGHSAIPGNEIVDALAKEAAENENGVLPNEGYTSLTHVKVVARRACLRDWERHAIELANKGRMGKFYKQHFGSGSPHWKAHKNITAKRTYAAMNQLKLGHGYFGSYLVRTANHESSRCFNGCIAKL